MAPAYSGLRGSFCSGVRLGYRQRRRGPVDREAVRSGHLSGRWQSRWRTPPGRRTFDTSPVQRVPHTRQCRRDCHDLWAQLFAKGAFCPKWGRMKAHFRVPCALGRFAQLAVTGPIVDTDLRPRGWAISSASSSAAISSIAATAGASDPGGRDETRRSIALPFPAPLVPALEAYLARWRPQLAPSGRTGPPALPCG